MNPRGNVVAALLLGLLVGAFVGSALDRKAMRKLRRQGPNVEKMVKRFQRDLKLDDAQSSKLRELLESRRGAHEKLKQDQEARFKALRAEIDADIETILTPEQKTRFAEKRAEWEKRREGR